MARVVSFFESTSDSGVHPTEVDCGWQVVTTPAGERLIQLSTYGSASRQGEAKVSQTLQFDEAAGRELLAILQRTFGS